MDATVEILAVGNELLEGLTQDTNTHWLCRQITALGGWVRRGAMVRDDREAIVAEIAGARDRGTRLLLVTGGLGPTADDLTLSAVAAAAEVPLGKHAVAREMVARSYEELFRRGAVAQPDLTPERLKMALLPLGAEPIENPVGAAPGVLLRLGPTRIVCLPGVPSELKAIFAGPLQPFLAATLGTGVTIERTLLVALSDESAMAASLREISNCYPDVYIKSHAERFQGGSAIRVTLSARGVYHDAVQRRVDAAARALSERLPIL